MKKVLLGAMLLGTVSAGAYAAREPIQLAPRGTIELGFEAEEYSSSNGQANKDFILPYIKTKTFMNQTTPYYIELNHSYRHYSDSAERETDKRRRYELFVGGYKYQNGNFTWEPKVGFRHEDYSGGEGKRSDRTYWRVYPGLTYNLTDKAALYVGGWAAYVTDDVSDEDGKPSEEMIYKQELEYGVKYKFNDKQSLTTRIYHDIEYYEVDGDESKKNTEYQFRANFYHKFTDKTSGYLFTRISLYRDTEYRSGSYDSNREDDTSRKRQRYGFGAAHKLDNDFTVGGEVYYQTGDSGSNYYDNGKYKNSKEKTNYGFIKLYVKYDY